jgi:nitrite reductase/ring-hydroxylating ferredoxin subunit
VEAAVNLKPNEFHPADIPPGKVQVVHLDGASIAVYNVAGKFYATQDACTPAGGPLSDGKLDETMIVCPLHGSCFDVTTGEVLQGPAVRPLKTYRVILEGDMARVE